MKMRALILLAFVFLLIPLLGEASQKRNSARRADYCVACARDARGKILRSASVRRAFQRVTGYPHGRRGYGIDHIVPLACGGRDELANLQWLSLEAKRRKDRTERRPCLQ
jgi:5-methylcytosine-specific restriction endonuclease McrA